jgi:hypothetical protein
MVWLGILWSPESGVHDYIEEDAKPSHRKLGRTVLLGKPNINVPLLLAHVLLTSSANLHASPAQAFSAARRSLR